MFLIIGDEMCHIYTYENRNGLLTGKNMLHFMQVWVGIGSREEVKSIPFLFFSLSLSFCLSLGGVQT